MSEEHSVFDISVTPNDLSIKNKKSWALTKKKKYKRYDQKYRKQWEEMDIFKGWLTGVKGEPYRAFCKACKFSLFGGRFDLAKHARSKKHQRNFESFSNEEYLEFEPEQNKILDEQMIQLYDNKFAEDGEEYGVKSISVDTGLNNGITISPKCKIYELGQSETVEMVSSNHPTIPSLNTVNDELLAFGQYVGLELKTAKDHLAIQRAKYEISKILYNLSAGNYSVKNN